MIKIPSPSILWNITSKNISVYLSIFPRFCMEVNLGNMIMLKMNMMIMMITATIQSIVTLGPPDFA